MRITGETTAQRLLSALNAARLSREELAEKAGRSPQTIFNILHHADHVPTVKTAEAIAAVFGVEPDAIFHVSTTRGGRYDAKEEPRLGNVCGVHYVARSLTGICPHCDE